MTKLQYFSDLPKKEDIKWKKIINDVLEQLPKADREKIKKECTVYCAYNKTGLCLFDTTKKVIILNCLQMEITYMPRWAKKHIVAHEFAHACHGVKGIIDEDEDGAHALMNTWGFNKYENVYRAMKDSAVGAEQ